MHVLNAVSSALPLTWCELTCHLSLLSLVVSVVWGNPRAPQYTSVGLQLTAQGGLSW